MKPEQKIREALKKEVPEMPEDVSGRFDRALEDVVAHGRTFGRYRIGKSIAVAAVTAFLVVFVLLPNTSADVSYAMQELPLIGGIVRVTTIYKKQAQDEYHFEDVKTPKIEGSEELEAPVEHINEDVEALTSRVIEEYEKSLEGMPEAHTGLMIDYEILTNNDRWFTMKLMVYHAAGSSMVEYYFYHIDKDSGELVTLSDLFDEGFDYVTIFSEEVKRQMHQRMEEDPSLYYWIAGEAEHGWGLDQIDPEQNFYLDADGNLVLVFGKYDVAPGYMGTPEFTIPAEMFQEGMAITWD